MAGDIDEIFPTLLAALDDVALLAGDRFFPNRIPQRDEMPAIAFERTGGSAIGTAGGYTGVAWATYRLTAWSAANYQEARQLNLAAQGIKQGADRVGGWWVQSLRIVPGSDQSEPQTPVDGSDKPAFNASTEYTVFYKRGK